MLLRKILFGLSAFVLGISGAVSAQQKDASLLFHYRFDRDRNVELKGNAGLVDGVLRLDGKSGYAVVPDSRGMHFTERGMTLVGVVKFNDSGTKGGENDAHDIIMAKGREFIFGRNSKTMYINFHDGKNWVGTTMGGTPAAGVWTHFAAVFERFNDPAQGDVGYRLSIFVNGEPEVRKRFLMVNPKPVDAPVEIGKGFGGGPWFFHGDIAEVAMYNRALTDGEIAKLSAGCGRVDVVRKGFVKIKPELQKKLETMQKNASPEGRWLLNVFRRMGATGFSQEKLEKIIASLGKIPEIHGMEELVKAFHDIQKEFRILTTDSLAVLLAVGSGEGAYPAAGVMDRRTRKDLFGERGFAWNIAYRRGRAAGAVEHNAPGVSWTVDAVRQSPDKAEFRITWNCASPFSFRAESEVVLAGPRIESSFEVINRSPDAVISDVAYPSYAFARLTGGNDTMVYPWMSGVLVKNPMEEQFIFGQEGVFPSGRIPLQFAAYYDDANGIYFGVEDSLARTKRYSATGKRGNLNIVWSSPVPAAVDGRGGNSFKLNGKAVIELYSGKWFEAGRIYRRFLEKEAQWWIPELPRRDTPEWFRDNTLWVLAFAGSAGSAEQMKEEAAYLRRYFELPFGIHWYHWNDMKSKGWPHFYPKDFVVRMNEEIRRAGVYTMPYIDSRLWQINDGPNHTDYMYRSHGLKYAVKNADGSLNNENYGRNQVFTVMCPGAEGWRNWMTGLTERVASYGFDAIYHDQVGTAAPKLCFDKTHGHFLNDGAVWLEQGYSPMFRAIRAVLQKKYPRVCHTTEEAADPYLRAMDGYMVWRWVDANQVPLFQSIYSGRAQFVGRVYNHQKPGDEQSFFSKAAQQLVNAEQLGWFTFSEIRQPGGKRLFIKKLMHIRKALLPYFNNGQMLPPVRFKGKIEVERSKWGGNFPQMVTMPKIASSGFAGNDGSTVYLFVNTVNETVSATPDLGPGKTFRVCREGAFAPLRGIAGQAVTLAPRTAEIWVDGTEAEAERIQAVMKKIASFDYGKPSSFVKKVTYQPAKGNSGTWFTVENIASLSDCEIAQSGKHVGRFQDGALISFGEIDFGAKGSGQLEVTVGVAPEYEGGSLDVIIHGKESGEEIAGTLKLSSTGGFREFKVMPLSLKKRLTGKHSVTFRINGTAACDFKSWRYLE